jgi:hypothetical protein
VGLLVVINLVVWPLKAMRYSYYYHGLYGPGYPGPFAVLWNSFAGLALAVLVVWLANRYIPGVHEGLEQLRPHLRHAVESFRQWWNGS